MNGKRFSENKARRNGFYLALAVCLVAVGVAAWSTFDAVQGYMSTQEAPGTSSVNDDPQLSRSPRPSAPTSSQSGAAPAPTPSPTLKPAATPKATLAPKPSDPPAAAPTPDPAAQEEAPAEEPQVPVNGPIYEVSEEMIYPVGSQEASKAYSAGAPVYSATMKDWRIHAGTDLAAEAGEQVLACGNGIVRETYTDRMLGNVARIEHGDYDFYYCGLGEDFLVSPGDLVAMGQAIGTVTAVPAESAEAPHLHLEVRRDASYLDPQSVLDGIN